MKNILFINHKQKQCGVYQYGYRMGMILSKSIEYNFIYCEVDSQDEYLKLIEDYNPSGIIYNYHPDTMNWMSNVLINNFNKIIHYGIHHEGTPAIPILFNNYILNDSTQKDNKNYFSVPRPIFENDNLQYSTPSIPTIGSFGFGFNNKGFERLCKLVNEQFDEAVIKFHIPFSYYGDNDGQLAKSMIEKCKSLLTKEKIKIVASHEFLTDEGVLRFLSENTLNAFLYDDAQSRGLSSVIDYAISVRVPIAITKTNMFRHISNTTPSICVEDRALKEIIKSGVEPLQQYRDKWSNKNLITKFEYILNTTLNGK